jgi:hypothetical protein
LLAAIERDAAPVAAAFTTDGEVAYPWHSLLVVATKA